VRVRDYRTESNAGNENVGYQGCSLKLACVSIDEIFEFCNA
jgi:hypothetical protein